MYAMYVWKEGKGEGRNEEMTESDLFDRTIINIYIVEVICIL